MREKLTDYQIEEMYKDMLDDCYGEVSICGYVYDASDAFSRVDPIGYRCGLGDFEANILLEEQESEDEDFEEDEDN